MKSYFFVPANSESKLDKVNSLVADEIIIDLEDAIDQNHFDTSLTKLLNFQFTREFWLRLPFDYLGKEEHLVQILKKIPQLKGVVIPKLESKFSLNSLVSKISGDILNLEWILLVENPRVLVELNSILNNLDFTIFKLKAIGLGSHDYCASMNMTHTYENLSFALDTIVNNSLAYNLEAIDIAVMDLKNENDFKEQTLRSFQKGFQSKFILHPIQLKWFNEISFYSDDEISEALEVEKILGSNLSISGVIKVKGRIIEKPHLNRIKRILRSLER